MVSKPFSFVTALEAIFLISADLYILWAKSTASRGQGHGSIIYMSNTFWRLGWDEREGDLLSSRRSGYMHIGKGGLVDDVDGRRLLRPGLRHFAYCGVPLPKGTCGRIGAGNYCHEIL